MQVRNTTNILAVALSAAFLSAIPAIVAWLFVPATALNDGGWIIFLETSLLLFAVVVPVLWRCSKVGIRALIEPLSLMSTAFLLYYVVRGQLLMMRDLIARPDQLLLLNPATNTDIAVALAYAIMGFCVFHLGYAFWRPPVAAKTSVRRTGGWNTTKVRHVAVAGVVVAILSTIVQVYAAGGVANTLRNIGRLRVETKGYGYALLGIGYWTITLAFVLNDRLRKRRIPLLPLLLMLGANLSDALDGNRSGVLAAWVTGLLLYIHSRGRQKVTRKAVLIILCLVLAVGFLLPMARIRERAASFEDALSIGREYWNNETSGIELNAVGEFCALDTFSTLIAVGPSQFPFRYGGTYVDAALFVIPRTLWPDKPRSFSFAFGEFFDDPDNDIPPGYIGELYINFHVPGIIAGMYLMGLLLRRVHRWIMGDDPVAITVYAVLAPYIVVFMGRSFIGGGTLTLIPMVLMLPIMFYLRRDAAPRYRHIIATSQGFLHKSIPDLRGG